ncbi:hypothetical protein ACFYW6_39995, partial [Streptomyces sp. NPDC002659]|uniref:hypothetical protein n=1 Tax=Streptomyces sp. NPDC002659 TaxID=3364656 RepID=UPI00369A7CCC
ADIGVVRVLLGHHHAKAGRRAKSPTSAVTSPGIRVKPDRPRIRVPTLPGDKPTGQRRASSLVR